MPATSRGITRSPYLVQGYARVCECSKAVADLGSSSTLDRAIKNAEGYWNVYLGFYGDQAVVFHWQVVDRRDGRVMWRDGRQLITEEEHRGITDQEPGPGIDWPF